MEEALRLKELHRRSLVKSLLWRVIGVVWTWVGAYIILLIVPPSHQSAAFIATLIVVYHHSTRLIMYYAYERIWVSVKWGRTSVPRPMSGKEKIMWFIGTTVALAIILLLVFFLNWLLFPERGIHFANLMLNAKLGIWAVQVRILLTVWIINKCGFGYNLFALPTALHWA